MKNSVNFLNIGKTKKSQSKNIYVCISFFWIVSKAVKAFDFIEMFGGFLHIKLQESKSIVSSPPTSCNIIYKRWKQTLKNFDNAIMSSKILCLRPDAFYDFSKLSIILDLSFSPVLLLAFSLVCKRRRVDKKDENGEKNGRTKLN